MVVGRKKIVYDPLVAKFLEDLPHDTQSKYFSRLAKMGLHVGQTYEIPTRRIQSIRRTALWNHFDNWPPCSQHEGNEVNWSEVRYKATVPHPMIMINEADAASSLIDAADRMALIEIL